LGGKKPGVEGILSFFGSTLRRKSVRVNMSHNHSGDELTLEKVQPNAGFGTCLEKKLCPTGKKAWGGNWTRMKKIAKVPTIYQER